MTALGFLDFYGVMLAGGFILGLLMSLLWSLKT